MKGKENQPATVYFPLDEPVTYALIGDIVKVRVAENVNKPVVLKR